MSEESEYEEEAEEDIESNLRPIRFRNMNLPPDEQVKVIIVDPDAKISAIKEEVMEKFNIPVGQYSVQLLFKGKNLADEKTLNDYGVDKKSMITVMSASIGA